ncbi:MAG: hypothetical protein U0797_06315 [Gemmataceae bacterium]
MTERTKENVARFASMTPQVLEQRLKDLACEWGVERVVAGGSGVAILGGLLLVAALGPAWVALPGVFAILLVMQAFAGWTPMVPLLRRVGFRRSCEVAHERYALKALRGDFHRVAAVTTPQDREDLSRFEGEGGTVLEDPTPDASDPEVVNEAVRAAHP